MDKPKGKLLQLKWDGGSNNNLTPTNTSRE